MTHTEKESATNLLGYHHPIIDPRAFAPSMMMDPAGYWVSAAQSDTRVCYPAEGNEHFFSIEEQSFWFRHRNALLSEIVSLFPSEGPFFDLGGGNGYLASGLEATGLPCVLVEPGPTGAANALRRGLTNVICSTVEAAKFNPGSLGTVGLFDVVEHIEDDGRFLCQVSELMKPGGRLYVTVPAFQRLWSYEDDRAGHYRRYSKGSLTASLERAEFIIDYVSYFFWFLPAPVFAFRTFPSALGYQPAAARPVSQREHAATSGLLKRFLTLALDIELDRVRNRNTIPFGSSCVAVARTS